MYSLSAISMYLLYLYIFDINLEACKEKKFSFLPTFYLSEKQTPFLLLSIILLIFVQISAFMFEASKVRVKK